MGYKITMSEIGPISLNETDPVKSILQNVSIILRTIKGSCPMYRGFGIDATLIDRPIPAAKVIFARSVPVYSEMLLPAWRSCVAYRAEPDHTKLLIVFSVRDETEKTKSPSAPTIIRYLPARSHPR